MTEKTVTVSNRAGIHARPAALIVQCTKNIKSSIFLEKNGDRINAKSIMGVITLGASYGSQIRIVAEGEDEVAAVEAVAKLFESKFEEA
ncbi:MAG: HPr family phosphocarrier protein [Treponema sp.]|jgi:phosphocarrier protein|nr:HPr family phosphocarrier protein [Treponema sp.]